MGILKGLCGGRGANCEGSQEDGVAWNDGVVPQHRFQHYNLYSRRPRLAIREGSREGTTLEHLITIQHHLNFRYIRKIPFRINFKEGQFDVVELMDF